MSYDQTDGSCPTSADRECSRGRRLRLLSVVIMACSIVVLQACATNPGASAGGTAPITSCHGQSANADCFGGPA
jgi:hypothetical protein